MRCFWRWIFEGKGSAYGPSKNLTIDVVGAERRERVSKFPGLTIMDWQTPLL